MLTCLLGIRLLLLPKIDAKFGRRSGTQKISQSDLTTLIPLSTIEKQQAASPILMLCNHVVLKKDQHAIGGGEPFFVLRISSPFLGCSLKHCPATI